jgi:hypothetical protein
MASHKGEYCRICKGPHKLRHGKPKKRVSRKRSTAAKKGWAHRRHITVAQEARRERRKGGGRRKSRKGRKGGGRRRSARR